ncbi:hypothetical protein NL676_010858 [Syzygium grande]|nr:hypothetical protein NL676_010858 [Syzygium grande]
MSVARLKLTVKTEQKYKSGKSMHAKKSKTQLEKKRPGGDEEVITSSRGGTLTLETHQTEKELDERSRYRRLTGRPPAISPERRFCARFRTWRSVRFAISGGRSPENELYSRLSLLKGGEAGKAVGEPAGEKEQRLRLELE